MKRQHSSVKSVALFLIYQVTFQEMFRLKQNCIHEKKKKKTFAQFRAKNPNLHIDFYDIN